MLGERWAAYGFIAPASLMLAVILGFPAVAAVFESLRVGGPGNVSFGLANYARLAMDAEFHRTALNTLIFVGSVVSLHMLLGMSIALLLNINGPVRWLFRLVAILPWTMPDVIGGLIFRFIFDTLYGGVNAVGIRFGLLSQPFDWLGNTQSALFAVIIAEAWRGYPYVMVILLAGLQSIPREQYEAAAIDGAGWWRSFTTVTLPHLQTMIIIALVLDVVWQSRLFGMIFGMTGGGPGYATQNLSLLVYKQYFQFFATSYASSVAVVLAAVLLAAALPYLRITLRSQDQA